MDVPRKVVVKTSAKNIGAQLKLIKMDYTQMGWAIGDIAMINVHIKLGMK